MITYIMVFHFGSDSRSFTQYESACSMDKKIMQDNNLKTPEEYRLFIQRNGASLMALNRNLTQQKVATDFQNST